MSTDSNIVAMWLFDESYGFHAVSDINGRRFVAALQPLSILSGDSTLSVVDQWMAGSSAPMDSTVYTTEGIPALVTLNASQPFADVDLTFYITETPSHGLLYQLESHEIVSSDFSNFP